MAINNKEGRNLKYNMKETELKQDIGVTEDELNFEHLMYDKIKKANNMIGLIKDSFTLIKRCLQKFTKIW